MDINSPEGFFRKVFSLFHEERERSVNRVFYVNKRNEF